VFHEAHVRSRSILLKSYPVVRGQPRSAFNVVYLTPVAAVLAGSENNASSEPWIKHLATRKLVTSGVGKTA
jgi:hypothetical protein